MKGRNMSDNKVVYSIDIGTRSLVGVLSTYVDSKLTIIDYEIAPHEDRAMYDGQVHNIAAVANSIRKITSKLKERNDVEITDASIAAAGRALKTEKVTIEKRLDITKDITKDLIDSVELEAIELAQSKIRESLGDSDIEYYCVGNSVISIILDEISLDNPVGHRGRNLQVSVVATFLPRSVSDTLYKVVTDAGLQILGLTLEPIAALEIAVPKKLRLLNLAIVDVGAGTSDIALTKDGGIYSYAMVDVAGDEVTEAIAKHYLLGFDEAEELKTSLSEIDTHKIENVVGIETKLTTDEVLNTVSDVIDTICEKIATEILSLNEIPPDAVFVIGGGSKLPSFRERLSKFLNLDVDRVAIKYIDDIKNVVFETEKLNGPEFVTPLGIGLMGHSHNKRDFISITLNGNILRLFNSKKLSISDALILTGFNPRSLVATRGNNLKFKLNGKSVIKNGKSGVVPIILLNGAVASIHDEIKHFDHIDITEAKKGEDAKLLLSEVVDFKSYVLVHGEKISRLTSYSVNGESVDMDYEIKNGDEIIANYYTSYSNSNIEQIDEVEDDASNEIEIEYPVDYNDDDLLDSNQNIDIGSSDDNQSNDIDLSYNNQSNDIDLSYNNQSNDIDLSDDNQSDDIDLSYNNQSDDIDLSDDNQSDDIDLSYNNQSNDIDLLDSNQNDDIDFSDDDDYVSFSMLREDVANAEEKSSEKNETIDIMINGNPLTMKALGGKMTLEEVFKTINYRVDQSIADMTLLINEEKSELYDIVKSGDRIRITWNLMR